MDPTLIAMATGWAANDKKDVVWPQEHPLMALDRRCAID
jgi:hypothetical protein